MSKVHVIISPQELMRDLLGDLKNGTATIHGDRVSPYHVIAEKNGSRIVCSLIENINGLNDSDRFYGLHLIDDVNMADCSLLSTDHLDTSELLRLIKSVYEQIEE